MHYLEKYGRQNQKIERSTSVTSLGPFIEDQEVQTEPIPLSSASYNFNVAS